MNKFLSILLSVFLALFLADAFVSLLDDALILCLGLHAISLVRGLLFVFSSILAVATYGMMAFTPRLPKRFFLPLVLFAPLGMLAMVPIAIYHFAQAQQAACLLSLLQLLVGLSVFFCLQGEWRWRWPLLREDQFQGRTFSWPNLLAFVVVNVAVLLPGVLLYLVFCLSLAIDHFSGGFLALHSDRLSVRAKEYRRADGKVVQLVPMIHIGETAFYRQVTESMPTNSVILLEGVTDEHKLLENKLSYQRIASALGLTEQHQSFAPTSTQARQADIDIQQFSPSTIAFLNLVIRVHATGLTVPIVQEWFQKSQDPALVERLWADLLTLRNTHLLGEIQKELRTTSSVVVPWGAAHMVGLSPEIQKLGFTLFRSQEYTAIQFHTVWKRLSGG